LKHKWILFLLVVVLILSLAFVTVGCGEKEEKHAIFAWDGWMPSHEGFSIEFADTTEELNLLYPDCLRGFFIPKWASDQYGITKTTDLNDPEIAKIFDIDADGIGDILGCDAVWTCAQSIDEVLARLG